MDESHLQTAFLAVLAVFTVSGLALRRSRSRRAVATAVAAPLLAWFAYEVAVSEAMPGANIRLDWFLLLPISLAHGAHAWARWSRLPPPTELE